MVPPGFDVPGFEPGFGVPGFVEPGFVEPGFAEPGFAESGLAAPLFGFEGDPGSLAPGVLGFVFGLVAPGVFGLVGFDPGALPVGGVPVLPVGG